jgi:hypothetical protein
MQYSPPIPFTNATQNNVKHPNDLKPGQEFVRLTMYTGEKDPVPSWPWPTFTWGLGSPYYPTLHGDSPVVGGHTFYPAGSFGPNCADWFQLGAYIVGLGPAAALIAGRNAPYYIPAQLAGVNVIVWPAPGGPAAIPLTNYPGTATQYSEAFIVGDQGNNVTPNVWDVAWIIQLNLYPAGFSGGVSYLYNTYYTGAGSEILAGVTTLRYGVVIGMTAVLFDDDGIGYVSYTGDWNIPFNYQRRAAGYVTCGWPINVNGWVHFVDNGGKLFRTDGSYVLEIQGPFNAKMIPEVAALATWPAAISAAPNLMQFDQTLHRLVFDVQYVDGTVKSAGLAMVDASDGTFQFLPDATNVSADAAIPRIETGGIKLVEPANRVQVAYADVDFEIVGTPTAYSAVPGAEITLTSTGSDVQTISQYQGYELVVKQSYISGNTIVFPAKHGLIDGEAVVYSAHGGAPLNPLVQFTTYYVIYVDDYTIKLSTTATITSGTSLTLAATNAFDGTFTDGPDAYILASGRQTVRCWLNKAVDRIPRFRITLNSPPNSVKCRIWGIHRFCFDKDGSLP